MGRMVRADPSVLRHRHITSSFPPTKDGPFNGKDEIHVVLPVILANSSSETLEPILDQHLGHLVDNWFQDFPLYDSKLMVLMWVWEVYKQLEEVCHHLWLHEGYLLTHLKACSPQSHPKGPETSSSRTCW